MRRRGEKAGGLRAGRRARGLRMALPLLLLLLFLFPEAPQLLCEAPAASAGHGGGGRWWGGCGGAEGAVEGFWGSTG